MAAPPSDAASALDSDSFLDIVANIVGILIILVMVVGLRIQQAPPRWEPPPEAKRQVHQLRNRVAAAGQELRRLETRLAEASIQVETVRAQLAQLEHIHRQLRFKLQNQQQLLSREQQELLAQVQKSQQALQQAQARLARQLDKPKTVLVVSYPTPVSRTVEGEELHFQLSAGHLAYVPFEELVQRLKEDARSRAQGLRHASVVSGSVGPIRGYRLRYVLQKVSTITQLGTLSYARLVVATFVPVREPPGVPLQEALAAGSEFRSLLARVDPQRTTITIWVHPDSFAQFRRLKKELYELGYAVAARPLLQGHYISASPLGTRSDAQ